MEIGTLVSFNLNGTLVSGIIIWKSDIEAWVKEENETVHKVLLVDLQIL